MFINDLIEKYLDFSKVKPNIDKLYNRKNNAIAAINQKIHFRDLVVRVYAPSSYGESKSNTNRSATKQRLKAHISSLFSLANEDHRANYCDKDLNGEFIIKKDKENHITRLIMNEFSLYTAHPFSNAEYAKLYKDIEKMAEELEPNVHILLSSFAVKDNNGKILNMSMYIEGGTPPKIHSFAKSTASSVDVAYGNPSQLFSQQEIDDTSLTPSEVIATETGENVYTGSVFEVQTVGGAIYTQATDVCLAHAAGHSREQNTRRIWGNAAPDEILPEQIEQCITSNTIYQFEENVISDYVLHADPRISMLDDYHAKPGKKLLDMNAINRIIPSDYPLMSIYMNKGGYSVEDPPFGAHYVVEVLEERAAGKYLPAYQPALKKHNEQVIERQLFSSRQHYLSDEDRTVQRLFTGNTASERIAFRIEETRNKMLEQCKPTLWERVFKTEEYRQKIEARKIISQSMDFMKDAIRTQGTSAIFLINPWKKDMELRLRSVGSDNSNNSFKQGLSKELNQLTQVTLKKDLACEFEQNPTLRS